MKKTPQKVTPDINLLKSFCLIFSAFICSSLSILLHNTCSVYCPSMQFCKHLSFSSFFFFFFLEKRKKSSLEVVKNSLNLLTITKDMRKFRLEYFKPRF